MDHPNSGIEPKYPTLQADSLPAEPPGKPQQVLSLGDARGNVLHVDDIHVALLLFFFALH